LSVEVLGVADRRMMIDDRIIEDYKANTISSHAGRIWCVLEALKAK